MAWHDFTATGGFASIFGLAFLFGSGCTGNAGDVNFDPITAGSAQGASGGSKPSGAGASGGSAAAGATAGSGTGGSGTGGSAAGGTNGGDDGGEAGANAGAGNQGGNAGSNGGSGGKGGSGGSGAGGASDDCTSATFGGHEYAFCGAVDSAAAAFELCEKRGMLAVSIESKAENDFLIGELAASTWLGASDEGHEGVWHWQNDVDFWDQSEGNEGPLPGQYQNWQEGQPNNANGEGLDENCALLEISDAEQGTWNDLACEGTELLTTCESTEPGIGPFPL